MKKLIFDIGATNTKFAVMTAEGDILVRKQAPTNYESAEAYFDTLAKIAGEHREGADAIAISSNGRMQSDGLTYRAYTRAALKGHNLKTELEGHCGLPVTVLNDGSAAALGEWQHGAGRGCRNLMVLVLGSGAGAGLILDGKLYEGSRRNAAAVFNMLGDCGGKDYQFAGFTTSILMPLYQLAAAKNIPFAEMSGERFFSFAEEQDPCAVELLEAYCRGSASLVYNAAMLLDLERVVVTGSITSQPSVLQGINGKLREMAESYRAQITRVPGAEDLFDFGDCTVQAVQGALTADANLYGTLYQVLQDTERK